MAKAVACEKCAEKDKEIILLQEENDRLMSSIDDANAEADAVFARAERAEDELAKFSRGWEPAALNVSGRPAEQIPRYVADGNHVIDRETDHIVPVANPQRHIWAPMRAALLNRGITP